jgi:hypothetical protein
VGKKEARVWKEKEGMGCPFANILGNRKKKRKKEMNRGDKKETVKQRRKRVAEERFKRFGKH